MAYCMYLSSFDKVNGGILSIDLLNPTSSKIILKNGTNACGKAHGVVATGTGLYFTDTSHHKIKFYDVHARKVTQEIGEIIEGERD